MTNTSERDGSAAGAREGLWDRTMRSTRRFLMLVLLLATGFLGLWWYAHHRVDEEIRAYVECRMVEHYAPQGIAASVGWARLIEGQAIEVHDIVLRDATDEAGQPIATIDGRPLPEVFATEGRFWRRVYRRALDLYEKGERQGLTQGRFTP